MFVDPKVGSMIPKDLSTKSDPMVKFDNRSWIALDPSVFLGLDLGSHRIPDGTVGIGSMI